MSSLITIEEFRRIVIDINHSHQRLLLDEGRQAHAKTLADRIADAERVSNSEANGRILKREQDADHIDMAYRLLGGVQVNPDYVGYWGRLDFPAGLRSALELVTLVLFSPRTKTYHQRVAARVAALASESKLLIDIMDSAPDLEQQFHSGLRSQVLPLVDLPAKLRTHKEDLTEGSQDRDREARAFFILAEAFLRKKCRMTQRNAFQITTILLWYTGVLGDETLASGNENLFRKAADKLSRRVRRLSKI